ncbi:hypothetical protein [Primorskyibacter sp. S87]|uniref:hypothetical protein n=1 Tax=Primorskyibacter sp. S87 TaxID=3415126 RepID=UPI003C7CA124
MRHGLTSPLAFDQVEKWYRIILDDPEAWPDPFSSDTRYQAALSLAEAEVRLERARVAEAEAVQSLELGREEKGLFDGFPKEAIASLDEDLRALVRVARRIDRLNASAGENRLRLTTRYRREAEAQRRKALNRWIKIQSGFPKQSQILP